VSNFDFTSCSNCGGIVPPGNPVCAVCYVKAVPCATCGTPTSETAAERCNMCWEVESRLKVYLNRGGEKARAFVRDALTEAQKAK
jgi:hypothetical protein